MRKVDRGSVSAPTSLTSSKGKGARELKRFRAYHATADEEGGNEDGVELVMEGQDEDITDGAVVPAVAGKKRKPGFGAYKDDKVRHALEALFHGKCAYCETRYDITAPVDVEHFRPKGSVDGITHGGYWWLAAVWWNLYPSCIDCNRRREQPTPPSLASLYALLADQRSTGFQTMSSGKGACFPIKGTRVTAEPAPSQLVKAHEDEDAVLLDPCMDDPRAHLRFLINRADPLGIVYPAPSGIGGPSPEVPLASDDIEAIIQAATIAGASVRGAVSIQIFGLNRLGLVQERTRLLRKLEILGLSVRDLSVSADKLSALRLTGPDQATVDEAISNLRSTVYRLLTEIREMASAKAPFSEMVRAWIKQYKADLAREAVILPASAGPSPGSGTNLPVTAQ